MKFKKDDLIARIDNLLANYEEKQQVRQREAEDAAYLQKVDWLNVYTAGFRDFADAIHATLDRNEPITIEDIPRTIKGSNNTSLKFYFEPFKTSTDVNRRYENLRKLRNALCASQEDTVSPTAIKQLGFQDVTFLFTQEAAA